MSPFTLPCVWMCRVGCDLLPYGRAGPPTQRRGIPWTAPAALRPSSSSPSSVCDAKVWPRNTVTPRLSAQSHRLRTRAHSQLQGGKDRKGESVRDERIEAGTEITGLTSTSSYCGHQSYYWVCSILCSSAGARERERERENAHIHIYLWPQIDVSCHAVQFAGSYLFFI